MSARRGGLTPPYPVYESGNIVPDSAPAPWPTGPADFRPSALNPYYSQYQGARGRVIAGLGSDDQPGVQHMEVSADGPEVQTYDNELQRLTEEDDVQGNGVFDPDGTQPNIHSDYGSLATRFSQPGYLAREQFYTPSEVSDLTTGLPVMYVPGGAVPVDDIQVQAFRRTLGWQIPPGVSPMLYPPEPAVSTVVPMEQEFQLRRRPASPALPRYAPVAGLGAVDGDGMSPTTKGIIGGVLLVASVGAIVYANTAQKSPRRRKSRSKGGMK